MHLLPSHADIRAPVKAQFELVSQYIEMLAHGWLLQGHLADLAIRAVSGPRPTFSKSFDDECKESVGRVPIDSQAGERHMRSEGGEDFLSPSV